MFKINKKYKYLIACSGGPDSMALLDMAKKTNVYIEVAHVNYHKRKTADRDQKIVRSYCRKNNIKLHVLNVNPNNVKGNFQNYAREARYSFFAKCLKKYHLDAVLVAHHKDDLIETYLMQIDKKLGVNTYGLSENAYLYEANVIRPLLSYTKKDLVKYCDDNSIEYGIDESNLSDCYERNKVRHSKIEKMSDKQKDKLVKEIDKKNKEFRKHFKVALKAFTKKDTFTTKEFLKLPYLKIALRVIFGDKSDKFFDEMIRQIKESKSYFYDGQYIFLTKEYDKVHIFMIQNTYSYTFNNMEELFKHSNYEYFKISKKGKSTEGVTISKDDFPITIRCPKNGDSISMVYGTKKINRFFIDKKIMADSRLTWPIVLDKKNNAILVPELGCNKSHYSKKHNLYVIKLKHPEDI